MSSPTANLQWLFPPSTQGSGDPSKPIAYNATQQNVVFGSSPIFKGDFVKLSWVAPDHSTQPVQFECGFNSSGTLSTQDHGQGGLNKNETIWPIYFVGGEVSPLQQRCVFFSKSPENPDYAMSVPFTVVNQQRPQTLLYSAESPAGVPYNATNATSAGIDGRMTSVSRAMMVSFGLLAIIPWLL